VNIFRYVFVYRDSVETLDKEIDARSSWTPPLDKLHRAYYVLRIAVTTGHTWVLKSRDGDTGMVIPGKSW